MGLICLFCNPCPLTFEERPKDLVKLEEQEQRRLDHRLCKQRNDSIYTHTRTHTNEYVDSFDLMISPNVYWFLPSKTVDLLYVLRPSSWTCTIVPKETRPIIVSSGSLAMASESEAFKCSSSLLSRQVSTINIKHGALGMFVGCGSWYSTTWSTSLNSPINQDPEKDGTHH